MFEIFNTFSNIAHLLCDVARFFVITGLIATASIISLIPFDPNLWKIETVWWHFLFTTLNIVYIIMDNTQYLQRNHTGFYLEHRATINAMADALRISNMAMNVVMCQLIRYKIENGPSSPITQSMESAYSARVTLIILALSVRHLGVLYLAAGGAGFGNVSITM